MKFNHYFVPQGAKVIKENNQFVIHYNQGSWDNPVPVKLELPSDKTVILDTGNALEPGIIDHHQPNCGFENQCVASLIVEHGGNYLNHLLGHEEVNIVTHFIPDLDALGAVYFTIKYLNEQAFTFLDVQLAEYINMVDMGKLTLDPEKPIGIASLWLNFTIINDYSKTYSQEFNRELIASGLAFMDAVISVISQDENPWTNEGFEVVEFLRKPIENILNDTQNYLIDIENSTTGIVELYNRETRGMDEVEVIISRDAKSFLWKYLVRGDRKNTLFGEGFKLTCLHMPGKKGVIISVDPNFPYSLKGLGVYLDSLEVKELSKTLTLDEIINGTEGSPRVGFHRNNPWYDGRGAHNFTIIDVPRGGTSLSELQINESIFAYPLWNSYAGICSLDTSKNQIENKSLNEFYQLDEKKRPFLVMNQENNEEVLEYNKKLCKFQIESFLNADKLIAYHEDYGSEIEKLCESPINDVFILADKIRESLKKLHILSFSNYEYITKCRYWSEMMAKFIGEGFSFFDNRAYEYKKNEFIQTIEPYINYTFAHKLLKECISIPPASFQTLFKKVEPSIKKTDLIYEILAFQTSFPSSFSKNNIQKILDNELISEECKDLIKLMLSDTWSSSIYEEIPIYAYNGIKNYVDDLFHLYGLTANDPELNARISEFKKTDFKQIVELELTKCDVEKLFNLKVLFEEGRALLYQKLFDDNFKKLKLQKYNIIKKLNPKEHGFLLNTLINLDFESLKTAPFNEVRSKIEHIEKFANAEVENNSIVPISFVNELKLIEELASFDLLLGRIGHFVSMKDFNLDDKYLQDINELLFSLLRMITLYTNFNNTEELQDEISQAVTKLDELRMLPSQFDRFDTNQLREKLAIFIPVILDEINLPVNDLDVQIQNGLSQYELIMGQGGIMEEIEKLPLFYRMRFTDIFSSFKRYYKERLNFFRNDLKLLIEESETGNEKKLTDRYIETCNNLINESVAFDWQELKDQVDESEENTENQLIKSVFYKKYFYWLSLNSAKNKEPLYQLNSEIRFAEGKSDENTITIIKNLPEPQNKEEISLYNLMVDFQLKDIIKHKPINLIHDSYDFLIEHFISKYHVDNVRETLARFSTKFPWYYKYLTDKKYLRLLFLSLTILMLGIGAFDSTIYDGKMAPLSEWLSSKLGNGFFTIISDLLAYTWGIIISLSFILPVLFLLNYLYRRYILNERPDDIDKEEKLNFFQLIESIEGKRSHLLYIPFVIPLLIVVLQMSSPDTISLINKIEGFRFFSTLFLVVGLTILSVYNYVKERNKKMSSSWLIQRTEHMLWLHLIQSFIISIFVIDLILRFQVSVSDFSDDNGGLYFLGMSKYIEIKRGIIDVVVMPTFTMMITILTLFFSFFIEKIFGNQGE